MRTKPNLENSVKGVEQGSQILGRGSIRQVNPIFRNSGLPALLAALLLISGYMIAVIIDNQPPRPPANLILIVVAAIAMFILFRKSARRIPLLSEKAASCIRLVSLFCITVEFLYFGVPLFGSIPYNEFGWPVIHHVAVMGWVLVLFGERYRKYDFGLALIIAVMLFNRQLALFTLLAFLMTSEYSALRLSVYSFIAVLGAILLGVARNFVLGIEITGVAGGIMDGWENFFFILLYLMGPMYTTNSLDSSLWSDYLSLYWNTTPEWSLLSQGTEIYGWISFLLFYGFFCSVVFFLRYSKYPKLQVLGFLIFTYTFFSFFSSVLISTPVLANFSVILFFMLLLPRKAFN